MLKHGILGLLNYHAMTGYEIMTVFRDSLRYFWSAQTSQIYRELQSLEEKGWVEKTTLAQAGRPDKHIYAIKALGREELLRWLADGELGFSTRNGVLMKVFFLGERSREENIRYFENLKEYCQVLLDSFEPIPELIQGYSGLLEDPEKARYWEMTVDLGRRNMKLYIDWAQDCVNKLREGKQP